MSSDQEHERRAAQLKARIAALEAKRRDLAEALAEADHQARRERDGLERAGGRAPAIEGRLGLLDEGRLLTRRALAETASELAAARAVVAALEGG